MSGIFNIIFMLLFKFNNKSNPIDKKFIKNRVLYSSILSLELILIKDLAETLPINRDIKLLIRDLLVILDTIRYNQYINDYYIIDAESRKLSINTFLLNNKVNPDKEKALISLCSAIDIVKDKYNSHILLNY